MATRDGGFRWAVAGWVAIALAAIAGFGASLAFSQALPEGPVEIVWDREACAHCRMHIGERAFAAQLQRRDGRVQNFDDPGCLLRYLASVPADEVHAVYFHHSRQARWLARDEVAFVDVAQSPMGFGLGAVHRGTPGSFPYEEALRRVERAAAPRKENPSW